MSNLVGALIARDECLALLKTSRLGRVSVSVDALPAILPVNYVINGESILFCASGGGDLYRATVGLVVAFEVDENDSVGYLEWSVLVRGIAFDITEDAEFGLGRPLCFNLWPPGEQADRFIVIPTTIISGRRFV